MVSIYGPGVVQQITDPTEVGRRFADSYGIESVETLIKGEEQQQADQQQAASAQAAMAAAPQLAKGAIDAMTQPGGAEQPMPAA